MLITLILVIFFPLYTVVSVGIDSYDRLRQHLGLEPDHSALFQPAQNGIANVNGKSKTPAEISHSHREHSQLSIRNVQGQPASNGHETIKEKNQIKPKKTYPPKFFSKETFIEKRKKRIIKDYPTILPDIAHETAMEHYRHHLKQRAIKKNRKREMNRKTIEYIKSVDENLASTMRSRPSNSKKEWIERRTRWLQKGNGELSNSEAEQEAQKQYLERLAKERIRSKERGRNRKKGGDTTKRK